MSITKQQRDALKSHFGATHVRVRSNGLVFYAPNGVTNGHDSWEWRRALRPDGEQWEIAGLLASLGDPSCEVIAVATGRRVTQDLFLTVAAADKEARRLNEIFGAPLCTGRRIGSTEGSI